MHLSLLLSLFLCLQQILICSGKMCPLIKIKLFFIYVLAFGSCTENVFEAVLLGKVINTASYLTHIVFLWLLLLLPLLWYHYLGIISTMLFLTHLEVQEVRGKEVISCNERTAGWQKLTLGELLTWIVLMKRGAAEVASVYKISAFSLETSICETPLQQKEHVAVFILILQLLSPSSICLYCHHPKF